MPFIPATVVILGYTIPTTTVIAVTASVASVVYSQVQAAQQRAAMEKIRDRNRGFGVSSREPAAVRRVIYGIQRVGGTIVHISTNQLGTSASEKVHVVRAELRSPTYLRHIVPVQGKSIRKRYGRRFVDAIHEAGHVVFGKLSGERVILATTQSDVLRECLGVEGINAATFHVDAHLPENQTRYLGRVVVAVAGRVVENWFCGTRIEGFPDQDMEASARWAEALAGPGGFWLPIIDGACMSVLECLGNPLIAEAVTTYAEAIMRKDPLEEPEIDAIWATLCAKHGVLPVPVLNNAIPAAAATAGVAPASLA